MLGMDDSTIKHLELVQGVIARLADNSFKIKSWAVALVSAVLVLSVGAAEWQYVLVALVPALVFWGLDAYYLRQERLFRHVYDSVRRGIDSDREFSMNTSEFEGVVSSWVRVCFVCPLAGLYVPIVVVIIAFTILTGIDGDEVLSGFRGIR